jgi:hypothetical protein
VSKYALAFLALVAFSCSSPIYVSPSEIVQVAELAKCRGRRATALLHFIFHSMIPQIKHKDMQRNPFSTKWARQQFK